LLGVGATVIALRGQSVQQLWFFTSDLIFVLLVPQLVAALFDPKANRVGSVTAFAVALLLRLGGGEPMFGLAAVIPYPWLFPACPGRWPGPRPAAPGPGPRRDPGRGPELVSPSKPLAWWGGVVRLRGGSRLTAGGDPPRPLRRVPG